MPAIHIFKRSHHLPLLSFVGLMLFKGERVPAYVSSHNDLKYEVFNMTVAHSSIHKDFSTGVDIWQDSRVSGSAVMQDVYSCVGSVYYPSYFFWDCYNPVLFCKSCQKKKKTGIVWVLLFFCVSAGGVWISVSVLFKPYPSYCARGTCSNSVFLFFILCSAVAISSYCNQVTRCDYKWQLVWALTSRLDLFLNSI